MSTNSLPTTQYTPAWKRIGLKLKYAADDSPADSSSSPPSPSDGNAADDSLINANGLGSRKRKFEEEDGNNNDNVEERRAKKAKKGMNIEKVKKEKKVKEKKKKEKEAMMVPSPPPSPPLTQLQEPKPEIEAGDKQVVEGVAEDENENQQDENQIQPILKPVLKKVQVKGGDSVYNLADPFEKNKSTNNKKDDGSGKPKDVKKPAPMISAIRSGVALLAARARGIAFAAAAEGLSGAAIAASSNHDSKQRILATEYLRRFHCEPLSWKFSKVRQNWIIRNLLNVEKFWIDIDDDDRGLGVYDGELALTKYIKGLQGDAARERVVEDIKKVVKELGIGSEENGGGAADGVEENDEMATEKKFATINRVHLVARALGKRYLVNDMSSDAETSSESDAETSSESETDTDLDI